MGFRQVFTLFFLFSIHVSVSISSKFNTYIVRVESTDEATTSLSTHEDLDQWYHSFLPSGSNTSEEEAPRMVHCYHNVFKGFAARLSPDHIKEMKKKPGFVSAEPHGVMYQDTTHSPAFLGLHQNVGFWGKSNYGKGVIVGVIDGGIYAEHPSFGDEGMPPPPAKWKGVCQLKPPSLCNKKLIGARSLSKSDPVPDDVNGHGTHVAATAAGNLVKGANVNGLANGTAVGIAPMAHLAVYKVCKKDSTCDDHDTLAAIDVAIDDGVDIISMSLNRGKSLPFYASYIAVGSYHAAQRGVFVSTSAGNLGPYSYSLSNDAPWILTAGASTTDRKLRATAVLGNGVKLLGESGFQPKSFAPKQYPLFYPDFDARNCSKQLARDKRANGKIVICGFHYYEDRVMKGVYVKEAGGVGMILINSASDGYTTNTGAHKIPATHLSHEDGLKLIAYTTSTSSPTAAISFEGTLVGDPVAPQVASFSSRGPSRHGRGILKPDILGPGVNILAAWPQSVDDDTKTTKAFYNIESGTSMSCPHLSGVAALLKSAHPDWSAAAIRSAIMTTADSVNLGKNPIQDEKGHEADLFTIGSGHVNPTKADNPGLVYDISPADYLAYLCGLNYTEHQLSVLLQQKQKCVTKIPEAQLNYPSFSIIFGEMVQKYTRTVTNVGDAVSVYTVNVVPPANVQVTVQPKQLSFTKVNQKLSYEVTFQALKPITHGYSGQGSITWTSQSYSVRIPVAAQPL